MAKPNASTASGDSNPYSALQHCRDMYCACCGVARSSSVKLKLCSGCDLVVYCGKACQTNDWKNHKKLCKDKQRQKRVVNPTGVLSVSVLMKNKTRCICDSRSSQLTEFTSTRLPLSIAFEHRIGPVSTLMVNLARAGTSADVIQVKALWTSASDTSSISTRLASRLGIERGPVIEVASFRVWQMNGYAPSSSIDVACADNMGSLVSTRLAPVIVDNPWNDFVLGRDWLDCISAQRNKAALLDFAPDKCRIRFVETEALGSDLQAFAKSILSSTDAASPVAADEGDMIFTPWGRPDPGPSYVDDPNASSYGHQVSPTVEGKETLREIVVRELSLPFLVVPPPASIST